MAVLRALASLLVLAALALPAQAAGDSLADLVEGYESRLTLRTEQAYAAQREALERIAILRTDASRATLEGLLARYGGVDRRRTAILLSALVRYGAPRDLDLAIHWVEKRKDPLLLDLLHDVVGSARLPGTQRHLREEALRSATPRVKAQIVRALGTSGDEAAVGPLLRVVREDNLLVRIETLEALGRLRSPRSLPIVQVFLRDKNPYVRDAAARGLGFLGSARAVPALLRALKDSASRVAESAATALAKIDDPRALAPLIDGLQRAHGKDLRLEDAFTRALQAISGMSIHADPELWRAWWLTVKDRTPFTKAIRKPGRKTVPGPSYYGFPVRSSKVVFVLDVSRSMGWNGRLDTAKKELIQTLAKLPRTTRFNLIAYSDRIWRWKPALTEAKPATVTRAIAFVRAQRALSGTNTYAALAAAFDDPDADTIFFLSDGHPSVGRVTDPDVILNVVRGWNRLRRVRVHCVALLKGLPPAAFRSIENADDSAAFMSHLAQDNGGRFRRVK